MLMLKSLSEWWQWQWHWQPTSDQRVIDVTKMLHNPRNEAIYRKQRSIKQITTANLKEYMNSFISKIQASIYSRVFKLDKVSNSETKTNH